MFESRVQDSSALLKNFMFAQLIHSANNLDATDLQHCHDSQTQFSVTCCIQIEHTSVAITVSEKAVTKEHSKNRQQPRQEGLLLSLTKRKISNQNRMNAPKDCLGAWPNMTEATQSSPSFETLSLMISLPPVSRQLSLMQDQQTMEEPLKQWSRRKPKFPLFLWVQPNINSSIVHASSNATGLTCNVPQDQSRLKQSRMSSKIQQTSIAGLTGVATTTLVQQPPLTPSLKTLSNESLQMT